VGGTDTGKVELVTPLPPEPNQAGIQADHVESIIQGWKHERPDVNPNPMGVVARISRLSRIMEKRVSDALTRHALTLTSFGILGALRRAGPPYSLSPKDLHRSLLVASGTVTNQLDRLEELDLIARRPSPHDRRAISVQLTAKGLSVIDEALVDFIETEKNLLSSVDEKTAAVLAHSLHSLLVGLGDRPTSTTSTDAEPPSDGPVPQEPQRPKSRFSRI
jgi:DNA-binding MarR family transcriptional regulator